MRVGLLGLMLLTAGCGVADPAPPSLPDSVLVEVLLDVHLADARSSVTGEPAESLRAVALARHELDTLDLRLLTEHYAAHPEPYLARYEDALDRLLREQRGAPAPPDTL